MKTLYIDDLNIFTDFSAMSRKWSNEEAMIPEVNISAGKVVSSIEFLLSLLPDDLANCILAELVEENVKIPEELLAQVFHKGDTGCRVAIALRDDLPEKIVDLCNTCMEKEVRRHFMANQRSTR